MWHDIFLHFTWVEAAESVSVGNLGDKKSQNARDVCILCA